LIFALHRKAGATFQLFMVSYIKPYDMRNLLVLLTAVLLLTSCKKETEDKECISLKESLSSSNIQQVKDIITAFISRLPSDDYSEVNINKLVSALSGQCDVSSGLYCFDCINTLPSQTEIWIEVRSGSSTLRKTIDLTYSNGSNKMKFGNMHD
jgi:hypothetical protein